MSNDEMTAIAARLAELEDRVRQLERERDEQAERIRAANLRAFKEFGA